MGSQSTELRTSTPSLSSLAKSHTVRSEHARATSSGLKKIVTSPPWAQDEPPSPVEPATVHGPSSTTPSTSLNPRPSRSALSSKSDSASTSNQTVHRPYGQRDEPLWWMFTRRGRAEGPPQKPQQQQNQTPVTPEKQTWPRLDGPSSEKHNRPMRERARSTWLAGAQRIRHSKHAEGGGGDAEAQSDEEVEGRRRSWGFHIPLPMTPAPITIAQNRTPGWDTPWSARPRSYHGSIRGPGSHVASREGSITNVNVSPDSSPGEKRTKWYHRRKRLRAFMLTNNYVPLLFRVINMTLTTAALAEAIKIRQKEQRYGIMGAVGSSPTLVIIFAPLTLVHVMAAIYLEYFGRPLGLWRTSLKLFHTLSETVFICLWSAALSLCFDNFFTSVIGCAPSSSTSWYNEIPRTTPDNPNLGRTEGLPGDYICDSQVALICLVFLGLIMYCSNLVISLFRIFEKVKSFNQGSFLPR